MTETGFLQIIAALWTHQSRLIVNMLESSDRHIMILAVNFTVVSSGRFLPSTTSGVTVGNGDNCPGPSTEFSQYRDEFYRQAHILRRYI